MRLELRVTGGDGGKDLPQRVARALNGIEGLDVKKSDVMPVFGMTGTEIIISFVVSVAGSALVHVFRDKIDEAVKDLAKELGLDISIKHKNDRKK